MSFPQHFSAQFLQKYTRIFLFTGWKTANEVHTAHRTESNRPGQRSIPGREQLFGASRGSRCCFVLRSLSRARSSLPFSAPHQQAHSLPCFIWMFFSAKFSRTRQPRKVGCFSFFFYRGMSSFSTTLLALRMFVCDDDDGWSYFCFVYVVFFFSQIQLYFFFLHFSSASQTLTVDGEKTEGKNRPLDANIQ